MKFIILLLAVYGFYKLFLSQRRPLPPPPQEPDIFIHHEEVKGTNEKN